MKLAGEFGTPYRPPCGGWPASPTYVLNGPWHHKKPAEDGLDKYNNTTKVADYRDPSDPLYSASGIDPYYRIFNGTTEGWPSGGTCPGPAGCETVQYEPPCAPWTEAEATALACAERQAWNCYTLDAVNAYNASRCRLIGFKNVQARKYWHGRHGFLSHDAGTCVACHDAVLTADQTKYRTMTMTGTITRTGGKPEGAEGATGTGSYTVVASRSVTIGRLTGAATVNSCEDSYTPVDWPPGYPQDENELISQATELAGIRLLCDGSLPDYSSSTFLSQIFIPLANGEDVYGLEGETIVSNVRDNDEINIAVSYYQLDADLGWYLYTLTAAITLTDPYTAADVVSDVNTLLDEYDLTDNVSYPWRTDGFVMVAPLVTYNELPTASPDQWLACDYEDDSGCDGSIVGSPLPAGYGPHFDFTHATWKRCQTDTSWAYYRYAQGAWSGGETDALPSENPGDATDAQIPRCATKWTENYDTNFPCGSFPGGAWLVFLGSTLMAQKWAETRVPAPSHNFARPCGADRFSLDETTVKCIQSSTAGSVNISEATGIDSDDIVYVCGDSANADGFYVATKVSDTQYSITAHPTWTGTITTECGTGIIGKVRFPTAPAICGRIGISDAVQDGSSVIITLQEAADYLRVGDHVDFTGVSGLSTNIEVATLTSSTVFTVTGTLSTPYVSGGFVSSTGAAAYKWHDAQWKGDYLVLTWGFDYRDIGEYDRLVACSQSPTPIRAQQVAWGMPREVNAFTIDDTCATVDPAEPYVICISPNGESFTHGATTAFPSSFPLDSIYGARWQAAVVQWWQDPFWQAPHAPCEEGDLPEDPKVMRADWEEDSGVCGIDATELGDYPKRGYVEAVNGNPTVDGDTAPALPAGMTLRVVPYSELSSATEPTGIVIPPPDGLGYETSEDAEPVEHETVWGIWIKKEACICAEGPMKTDYESQGVRCY